MVKVLAHHEIFTVISILGGQQVVMSNVWAGDKRKLKVGEFRILSPTKLEFPRRRRGERFLVRYTVMEETIL